LYLNLDKSPHLFGMKGDYILLPLFIPVNLVVLINRNLDVSSYYLMYRYIQI
jgi:hypothetical protein